MNLYLISQDVNTGYDTFDSAVVAAETEEEAKTIHPADYNSDEPVTENTGDVWSPLSKVQCKLLGTAIESTEKGVICASFNAG